MEYETWKANVNSTEFEFGMLKDWKIAPIQCLPRYNDSCTCHCMFINKQSTFQSKITTTFFLARNQLFGSK